MPIISRRSARGTLRLGGEPDTSGTPPLETDDSYETTLRDMEDSRGAKTPAMTDARYVTWYRWGQFKHLFRIHTFVPLEVWDPQNGSMQYIGRICWHCPEQAA
jgi:hypothetical protein